MRITALSNRKRDRAFTLVELLVVIGIIALLISILMPALSKVKAQANKTACSSNMRSIGQAMIIYANDNKGVTVRPASGSYGPHIDDFMFWQLNPLRNPNDTPIAKVLKLKGDAFINLMRCPSDTNAPSRNQFDPTRPYGG